MTLNKAIEHGKEKRKPYTDGKKYVKSCRNHGDCPYCGGNRLYSIKKAELAAEQCLEEYEEENDYEGES